MTAFLVLVQKIWKYLGRRGSLGYNSILRSQSRQQRRTWASKGHVQTLMLGGKAKNCVCFFIKFGHTYTSCPRVSRGYHGAHTQRSKGDHGGHAQSDNGRAGGIVEAASKAIVGLMKAKASPKMVEEFTEAEVVPTVAEGIIKAVPNFAKGPSCGPMWKKV